MAWITLALRKQTLKAEISDLNFEDLQLSREKNAVHRHLAYEQSIFEAQAKRELKEAKEASGLEELKKNRPSVQDDSYEEWKVEYAEAKEEYEAYKQDILDMMDEIKTELEEEAKEKEEAIDEQITIVETQRDAMNAELQAISDQIKTEIENSAIKF
jgi:hypothetical protein